MAARRCIGPTPGQPCPLRALTTNSRCQSCRQAYNAKRNADRPWYSDPEYRATRAHLQAHATHCHWCGTPLHGNVHVDHEPPIAQLLAQGRDWRDAALLPACAPCNLARGGHGGVPSRHSG